MNRFLTLDSYILPNEIESDKQFSSRPGFTKLWAAFTTLVEEHI
jgi:hypothetical protein